MLILETLINLFLCLGCCFAGVYTKNHPDLVAGYCSRGRVPSATSVRNFRIAGIVFLVFSLLVTAVGVAFFAWSIYMASHL
jgi:hypothetical protein